jgi:putative transposase
MKRKRYTEEQIISILKQHEAGRTMVDLAREYGIAENTLYRWKSKVGGVEVAATSAGPRRRLLTQRTEVSRGEVSQVRFPTLHGMLWTEGHVQNHKRTYRTYCEEGLQVRTKTMESISCPLNSA